jgi:CRISPR type IV-associated protein Csf3
LAQLRDIFRASVAWFDVPAEKAGIATIYKRFHEADCHEIDTTVKKVQVGRGHFRAYMMRLPYLPARSATFYVNGDIQEILRLISYLPGLGKKVAYGYGMIRSVSVEETPEDYSLVKDGVAMRPLPCSLGFDSDERMMLAFKAPYWDKRNVAPCVPPGAVLKRFG